MKIFWNDDQSMCYSDKPSLNRVSRGPYGFMTLDTSRISGICYDAISYDHWTCWSRTTFHPLQRAGWPSFYKERLPSQERYLFIAYDFPPDAAVAGIMLAEVGKYLRQRGWEPIILAIRHKHIALSDCKRLKDVEHVVRTRMCPAILELVLRVGDACVKNAHKDGGCNPASSTIDPRDATGRGVTPSKKIGFLGKYITSVFEIPVKQIGWLRPAAWKAYWLVKNHDIRLALCANIS